MYVLIEKENEYVTIYKELSRVLHLFDLHRTTLSRRVEKGKYETDKYILYKADKLVLKSLRGGKNSNSFKKNPYK